MRSFPPQSARVLLVLLSVLATTALPGLARAKDTDSNALGFKAYEKGDYKKAHTLFEKALKQNPDNPYARLNRARTTVLLNQSKGKVESAESCDYAKNWVFRALSDLSKAVELDRATLLPKIDEDQKGLKPLKAQADYAKWRKAVGALASDAGGTEKVLKETSDWWYHAPGAIPVGITLHPDKKVSEMNPSGEETAAGQWSLKGQQLELTPLKGKPVLWDVRVEKYAFNEGKDFFFDLQLVATNAEASASPDWLTGPLRAGPITGDCE
jgi:hypothetical protein